MLKKFPLSISGFGENTISYYTTPYSKLNATRYARPQGEYARHIPQKVCHISF